MYTYHYCAQRIVGYGTIETMDGIAIVNNEILTMDDYQDLKKEVWKDDENFGYIMSLTLLSK